MLIEIKNRWNGTVNFAHDAEENSMKVTLSAAVSAKCNLSGSDLSGSDLRDSNLSGSNLSGSDLSGSDLSGSDLRVSQIGFLLNAMGVIIS